MEPVQTPGAFMPSQNCPYCHRDISLQPVPPGSQVSCPACGGLFVYIEASQPNPYTPPSAPVVPYGARVGDEVYGPYFDLNRVDGPTLATWSAFVPDRFETALAVILNLVTCGLFGIIYYGLKHGELPKISREDPGAGKAIGFCFIPYFNLYWIFRFWPGLVDRITLQLRLRNKLESAPSRSLATACCILTIIGVVPYFGCLAALANIVTSAILVSQIQSALNTLADNPEVPPRP